MISCMKLSQRRQLARAFGAHAIATAGSDEKIVFCQDLGADCAIHYRNEDFEERVFEFTDRRGVNLVLDMVGGSYFPKNISLLAVDGRLVQIACLEGEQVSLDLGAVMQKRLTITGSTLRPQSFVAKARIARELIEKVWPLFASRMIRPTVYRTFPLSEAKMAHELLESNRVCGKIVLII